MKIAVLVKQVPDTSEPRQLDPGTQRVDRAAAAAVMDEINERAMTVALEAAGQYRLAAGGGGTEIVVVTLGPERAAEVLRRCLALGADSAVHVLDDRLAGADAQTTSAVLAAAVRGLAADLVVTGCESTDGRTGAVPAMLAEHLGYAQATYLASLRATAEGITGRRVDDTYVSDVVAAYPCVVSVTEEAAEPRNPHLKGIMGAKKKPLALLTAADVDGSAAVARRSVVAEISCRPPRGGGVVIEDEGAGAERIVDLLKGRKLECFAREGMAS